MTTQVEAAAVQSDQPPITTLQVFKPTCNNWKTNEIRVYTGGEEPLFIAKDVCAILGLGNVSEALTTLDDDEKDDIRINDVAGRLNKTKAITESGMYSLIFKSKKKEAKEFRKWVTSEVLPALRKDGEYKLEQQLLEREREMALELENKTKEMSTQQKELNHLNKLLRRKVRRSHKIGNCVYIVENPDLDDIFKIGSTKDINNRVKKYQDGTPNEIKVLYQRFSPMMKQTEEILLYILDTYRCQLDYKGAKKREWMKIDPEVIRAEIDALCDFIEERKELHTSSEDVCDEVVVEDPPPDRKKCVSCEEEKKFEFFYARPENIDGYEGICKECYAKRQNEAKVKKRKIMLKNKKRKCNKCSKIQPLHMFKEHPTSRDGFNYICSECIVKPILHKTEKKCAMCKDIKPMDAFNNCRTSVDGKFGYCRPCTKVKNKIYKDKAAKEKADAKKT